MADVQIFREHLEKHNLVGFGGYKIKTYCDEEGNLKKTLGTGKWKHINRDNFKEHIGKDKYGNNHSYQLFTDVTGPHQRTLLSEMSSIHLYNHIHH